MRRIECLKKNEEERRERREEKRVPVPEKRGRRLTIEIHGTRAAQEVAWESRSAGLLVASPKSKKPHSKSTCLQCAVRLRVARMDWDWVLLPNSIKYHHTYQTTRAPPGPFVFSSAIQLGGSTRMPEESEGRRRRELCTEVGEGKCGPWCGLVCLNGRGEQPGMPQF